MGHHTLALANKHQLWIKFPTTLEAKSRYYKERNVQSKKRKAIRR